MAQQTKNPRRVAAGRLNRKKWRGFTPEGLERLRAAALANRPWEHATGPRTAKGKSRSAQNGKMRKSNSSPPSDITSEAKAATSTIEELAQLRAMLATGEPDGACPPSTDSAIECLTPRLDRKEENDRFA